MVDMSLEFAFQFLGDVCGKTIVALGCGKQEAQLALTSLGARVISVDIASNKRIPVDDNRAHAVLSNSILRHVDAVGMARQIRRILKPGGVAVFHEPVSDPFPLAQAGAVSRAVGRPGRFQFGLSLLFIDRVGIQDSRFLRMAQRLDNWVLERIPLVRRIAAPLVWEARKEG